LFVGMATTSHDITRITTAEYREFRDTSFPGAVVTITQHPVGQTVDQHSRVIFSANASLSGAPASELVLQWQRSDDDGATWTNIRGANSATYSIQFPTQADDDQALFRLVASVPGESAASSAARLTVGEDNTPPRLLFVVGTSPTNAVAYFSEPMHPDASEPFGFTLNQGASVGNAEVNEGNPTRIDLHVAEGAPLVPGTTYTLTIDAGWGITDVAGNEVAPPASAQFLAQNFDGDPDLLVQLPPERALPLDSLSGRGFDLRLVQNPGITGNIDIGEAALAGTLLNPTTGQPYANTAPLPEYIEPNIINYDNQSPPTSIGRILGDVQFPGFGGNDNNFAVEVRTYLELHPGIVRMGVNSDDSFRVRLATGAGDPEAIVLGEYPIPRGQADTLFDFLVVEAGLYPFRLTFQENTGDARLEWWIQDLATMEYVAVNARDDIKAFLPPAGVDEPELAIELNAATDEVVISWPASASGFRLQRTLTLSEPAWSDVADTPVDLGGGRVGVTLSTSASETAYFRLVN
jgi:hypothetical protein